MSTAYMVVTYMITAYMTYFLCLVRRSSFYINP